MLTTANPPRLDLIHKLLARALDPSARDGEAETSAVKMVAVARRENVTLPRFEEFIAGRAKSLPAATQSREEPVACSITMPFGKHKGETLGDIARHDPGYIRWMAEHLEDEFLHDAAQDVRDWFTAGRRA